MPFSQWRPEFIDELSREQRLALILLGVCAVASLGIGALALQERIHGSFLVPKQLLVQSQAFYQREAAQQDANDILTRWDANRETLSEAAARLALPCKAGSPCSVNGTADQFVQASASSVRASLGFVDTPSTTSTSASDAAAIQLLATSSTAINTVQIPGTSVRPPASMTPTDIRSYLLTNHLVTVDEAQHFTDDQLRYIYTAAYQQAVITPPASANASANGSVTTP